MATHNIQLLPDNIKESYRLALEDTFPDDSQKVLKDRIYESIIYAFSVLPINKLGTSDFYDYQYQTEAIKRLKDYLRNGDGTVPVINITEPNIESALFIVDRVFVMLIFKRDDFDNVKKLRMAENIRASFIELRFKNSQNEYYYKEFTKLIEFLESKIEELSKVVKPVNSKIDVQKSALEIKQKFTQVLTPLQQEKLVDFIGQKGYVNNPKEFVGFLTGANGCSEIQIIGDNETVVHKHEIAICYLIFLLKKYKHLKLNFGRDYVGYLELDFCPLTLKGAKGQYKSNIRKLQRTTKLQKTIGKHLTEFVLALPPKKD